MRRLPAIPTSGAVVVWLASTMAIAQQPPIQSGARPANSELAAAWAQDRPVRVLSNQLRPFYRYELMHVRGACGLSREPFQTFRPELDAVYLQAIAGLHAARAESRRSPGDDEPDYQETIRQAVHSVVRRHVSGAQWDALQADLRARATSRKEAGTDMLVAVLDRTLLLTARQRREIAASIAAHWEDRFLDPLEVAFNDQSRCPKIPDELIASSLSPAQRETWTRTPQLEGRLWGVTVDHGGGPAIEQALGAVGPMDRPLTRSATAVDVAPRPVAIRAVPAPPARAARARAAAPRQAIDLAAARQRAAVARPAPPRDADDEADPDAAERQQRAQLDQMERLRFYLPLLERQVFGAQGEEATSRLEVETALEHRADYLRRASGLTEEQGRKLRAAGHGDIKRFFDHYAEARGAIAGMADQRAVSPEVREAFAKLPREWRTVRALEGPIFTRTVDRTLTEAHRAVIAKEDRDRAAFRFRADIRWTTVLLARSLGLTDDKRRRLESLLLERANPPERFESSDYIIVMFEASQVPEHEIRPIFDDLQWRVMQQEFAAVRRWEGHQLNGGRFEMLEDEILPRIRILPR